MNETGQFVWVSDDKVLTEIDPFFISSYGYQDATDQGGEKHLVVMTVAGAPNPLKHLFGKRDRAMELIDRIRQAKIRH